MLIQLNRRLIIARRPAADLVADIVLALVEHAVGFPDHFVDLVWGLGLAIDIAGRNMDVKLQVQNLDLFQVFPDLLVNSCAAGPGAEGSVAVDQLGLLALDDEDGIRPGILKVVVQPVPGFQVGIQDVDVVEAREKGSFFNAFKVISFPAQFFFRHFFSQKPPLLSQHDS